MNIIEALRQEETKLHQQLTAIQSAIAALKGGAKAVAAVGHANSRNGTRTLSAAGRARISRAAKARWAKVRAEKAKKLK